MIDPKDYPLHVEQLGGVEQFEEYIRLWNEAAPWMSEKHIKEILDGEEQAGVSMSMWTNPYMP